MFITFDPGLAQALAGPAEPDASSCDARLLAAVLGLHLLALLALGLLVP